VKTVEVVPELVELMQYVVEMLDSSEEDERSLAESDDGLQTEHGVGGRASDGRFQFDFYPPGRDERWSMVLGEDAVRAIADGGWKTLPVEVQAVAPEARPPRPAPKAPPKSRGQSMLDALVEKGLVLLEKRARVAEVAAALEEVALPAIDHPSATDEDKAATIVEARIDLPGIEEVFGDDREVFEVVKRFAD